MTPAECVQHGSNYLKWDEKKKSATYQLIVGRWNTRWRHLEAKIELVSHVAAYMQRYYRKQERNKKQLTGKIPALIAFNLGFMASYLESEATCTSKPVKGNIFIRLKAALINYVKDNCVMGKGSLPQTHKESSPDSAAPFQLYGAF